MCSVSLSNGVVSVNAKDGLVSSKSVVQGAVTSKLAISQDGENINQLQCSDNSQIALTEGGAYDVRGNSLVVGAELDEESTLVVNSDGNDSAFELAAGVVMQSFSDNSQNNQSYLNAALSAVTMLNNAKNNTIVADATVAQFYSEDGSSGNYIDSSFGSNFAVLSGKENTFESHGNSEINISENAERTRILGSDTGDDIVNDKAGSSNKTEGKTYYSARNTKGAAKLNWFGLNGLADIRNLLSSEVNYYGTNNAVFAQDGYKDDSGKYYTLQDFIYRYGWNTEGTEE